MSLLSGNVASASGAIGLRPYHRPKPLAGTTLTTHTRPGDNLAIHRAFEFCHPSDLLVIDGAIRDAARPDDERLMNPLLLATWRTT
ncbi:regulator of RNase E activity RraA [Paraburkholderia youngii]